jgi:hypothetical protein
MIAEIIILIFISFLQGALLPFDLMLLILTVRSFVVDEKLNYWLAFGFGLLLSLLLGFPLGSLSLIYLLATAVVYSVKRTEFASNWLIVVPLVVILLIVDSLLQNLLMSSGFTSGISVSVLLAEVFLVLPIYFLIRFWEERFIPKKDIRLKVKS